MAVLDGMSGVLRDSGSGSGSSSVFVVPVADVSATLACSWKGQGYYYSCFQVENVWGCKRPR